AEERRSPARSRPAPVSSRASASTATLTGSSSPEGRIRSWQVDCAPSVTGGSGPLELTATPCALGEAAVRCCDARAGRDQRDRRTHPPRVLQNRPTTHSLPAFSLSRCLLIPRH